MVRDNPKILPEPPRAQAAATDQTAATAATADNILPTGTSTVVSPTRRARSDKEISDETHLGTTPPAEVTTEAPYNPDNEYANPADRALEDYVINLIEKTSGQLC